LSRPFGLQQLLGKTVAIIPDARLGPRADLPVIVELLLSISGGDSVTVSRKFLPDVIGELPVRFTIMTNELPQLADSSGALARRFILLRLTESWYDKEDIGLLDKLLTELPGILLWASQGWRDLQKNSRFTVPDAGNEMSNELADLASPIGKFIRERCNLGPECQVETKALYEEWRRWCSIQGLEPLDAARFGRDLFAAVLDLKTSSLRTPSSGRSRHYVGIKLQ
jgi:putative DNA primase/helicase